jgi:outer membrane protein, heavy metal efflux system
MSDTLSNFESRTLNNRDLKAFIEKNLGHEIPWPPPVWDFGKLALAALYYNPQLDTARAKWGIAKAGIITAAGRPNPRLRFLPEYAFGSPQGVSPWIAGLSFDVPIETAGKRTLRIARAEHLSDAAYLDVGTVAWHVRGALRTSLLDLYVSLHTMAILERQFALEQEVVRILEKRLFWGEASSVELTVARISVDHTFISLQDAQRQTAESRVKVADAIGVPAEALREACISFDAFERLPALPPLADQRRRALTGRTDIISALLKYQAAESALQLALAGQYPDLQLGPGYEFDQGENKWSFGFSVVLPILNRNQGPIAEAEARRRQASMDALALQAVILRDIDLAQADYLKASEAIASAERLVEQQRKQMESMQAHLEAGEADRLHLLGAKLAFQATTLVRVKTLYEAEKAVGLLEDALQQPFDSQPYPYEANTRGGAEASR